MANIYDALVGAISQHWKDHDNKYPLNAVLSPAQLDALGELRRIGRVALATQDAAMERDRFMGVPLEIDPASPGVLVAIDGAQIAVT